MPGTEFHNREISIEANWRELCAEITRVNGGLLADTADVFWYANRARASFLNGVLFANFASGVETRAGEIVEGFEQRARPWLWIVGPSSGPAALPIILQDLGLALLESTPGMVLQLEQGRSEAARELEIVEVGDGASAELWLSVRARNHGLDTATIDGWRDTYFAEDRPIRGLMHFVGIHRSEPVACASLFMGSDVAGIYHVDTVPGYRRRGFATAMTTHTLDLAARRGYGTAVLSAAPEAVPLYRKMGFQEVTRLWTFQPKSGLAPATLP